MSQTERCVRKSNKITLVLSKHLKLLFHTFLLFFPAYFFSLFISVLAWATHVSLITWIWATLASDECWKQKCYPHKKKYSVLEVPLVATLECGFGSQPAQIIQMENWMGVAQTLTECTWLFHLVTLAQGMKSLEKGGQSLLKCGQESPLQGSLQEHLSWDWELESSWSMVLHDHCSACMIHFYLLSPSCLN